MTKRLHTGFEGTNRAVSPVIGVILMVAISVILAAVVGAFVLEVGDQQETAPTATFSFDQEVRYYGDVSDNTNLTTVVVTHSGGDTLDIAQLNIKIEGNKSVWGPTGEDGPYGDLYRPQPDHFEAATTNKPVTIKSGDRWTVNAYMGFSDASVKSERIRGPFTGYYYEGSGSFTSACEAHQERGKFENPSVNIAEEFVVGAYNADVCTDRLTTGDEFRAVWQSASGSTTQVLTKYTVQEDGAPGPQPK